MNTISYIKAETMSWLSNVHQMKNDRMAKKLYQW